MVYRQISGKHLIPISPTAASSTAAGSIAGGQPIGPRGLNIASTPELRDSNAANDGNDGNTSAQLGGATGAFVSTGNIFCESSTALGLEALVVYGPLSFQAEYGWLILNDVTGINGTITPVLPEPRAPLSSPPALLPSRSTNPPSSYMFNGGYIQASYFLTGESRSYDHRFGKLDSVTLGKNGPGSAFYLGNDPERNWGLGAWELAVRYSYLDLNDGAGATRVNGGVEGGFSAGINWYLTNNLKYQFQYQWNDRYQTIRSHSESGRKCGRSPGIVEGFGIRMQWMF